MLRDVVLNEPVPRAEREIRTFALVTLGCKANQYDSELIRETLLANGLTEARNSAPDLVVVNTCTVTHQADAEGRQLIRRFARRFPECRIIVTGCYAARDPETLRGLPNVVAIAPHADDLERVFRQFGLDRVARRISRFSGHRRAFVRIQDGCLLRCTFCIIPKVRPSLRSRKPEEIEGEIRDLLAAGYHEIVLTGIHLGHYGLDWPYRERVRLWQLIERLARIEGQWRLRISSLEAVEVNDDFLRVLRDHPRICPHLHLCLQSGSDRILAKMNRRYRVANFLRRVDRVRAVLDKPAITTDVIVGFPGETEADFRETVRVCEQVGFSRIHVFPFSARRGTPAASMPDQVPPHVIRARRAELGELADHLASRFRSSLVGAEHEMLVERQVEGANILRGTSERYVEIRVPVAPQLAHEFIGKLVRVEATGAESGWLAGKLVDHRFPALPLLQAV